MVRLRRTASLPLASCETLLMDAAPVVSTVSTNAAPSGGGTVTIGGLSFGAAGPTATASLTAADVCGSSAWTSATTVACAAQAYGGTAGVRTAVSVSAVAGTATGQLSFDGAIAPHRFPTACVVWNVADGCSAGREHGLGERRSERRRHRHDRRAELRRCRPNRDGLADRGGRVRQQRVDVGDHGRVRRASVRRDGGGADGGEREWSGGHSDGAAQLRWCDCAAPLPCCHLRRVERC
jgi:hypothetical protein